MLRERGWRIEQMPCPEHGFLGLHRFWLVKEQADTLAFRRHCRRQAKVVAGAIAAHLERGSEVVVIGLEGSPSMGVRITSSNADWGGRPDAGDSYKPRARTRHLQRGARRPSCTSAASATCARPASSTSCPGTTWHVERKQLTVFLEEPSGR